MSAFDERLKKEQQTGGATTAGTPISPFERRLDEAKRTEAAEMADTVSKKYSEWADSYTTLIKSVQDIDMSSDDSYGTNAQALSALILKQTEGVKQRAATISEYLDKYGDYYDKNIVSDMRKSIDAAMNGTLVQNDPNAIGPGTPYPSLEDISAGAVQNLTMTGNFANKAEYDAALAEYNKFYNMSDEDYQKIVDRVDKWSGEKGSAFYQSAKEDIAKAQYYRVLKKYGELSSKPDFAEKSANDSKNSPTSYIYYRNQHSHNFAEYAEVINATEEEIKVLNYINATQGDEAEEKWYRENLQSLLKLRQEQGIAEREAKQYAEVANMLWYGKALATAITIPQSIAGGFGSFVENIGNQITGQDIDTTSYWNQVRRSANITRSAAQEDMNPVGAFFYNAGLSTAESLIGGNLIGKGYSVVMGMSAASNEAERLQEKGATKAQIALGSLLAGTAEALFEEVSLDKLLKTTKPTGFVDALKKAAAQAGVEASEEVFTEIANTITNCIVMGKDSDFIQAVQEYQKDGETTENARRHALFDKLADIGLAGLSGAVSGGLSAGGQMLIATGKANRAGRNIKNDIRNPNLKAEIIDAARSSKSEDAARNLKVIDEATAKGKDIPDVALGNLAADQQTQDAFIGNRIKKLSEAQTREVGTFAKTVTDTIKFDGDNRVSYTQDVEEMLKKKKGETSEQKSNREFRAAQIEALRTISEITGVKIGMYASTEIDRANIADIAPNGWYDEQSNTLYVDANAGANGAGLIMFTAAHEFTHATKTNAETEYNALRDFLKSKTETWDADVQNEIERLDALNRFEDNATEEDKIALAEEELTARSMEGMLKDGKVINALAESNPTVAQKIFDFVKQIIDKLKTVLAKLAPESKEAKALSQDIDTFTKAQELYTAALKAVGQNVTAESETPSQTAENADTEATEAPGNKNSDRITDKSTLDFLNEQLSRGEYDAETNPNGGYYVTYKSMSFWGYDEDGNAILRSPMAERIDGKLSNAYLIPKDTKSHIWYQATESIDEKTGFPKGLLVKTKLPGHKSDSYLPASEHTDLIKDDWSNLYFNLRRVNEETGEPDEVKARYNPYEHSSDVVLNDQFKGAYKRANLVTVKMYVPVSEDNGAFRAKYAKDPTGWTEWKSGDVAGAIAKQKGFNRNVFLSRYATPVEILSDAEVAAKYKEYLDGTDVSVPDNVVSPGLLNELRKIGVKIESTGKPEAYAAQIAKKAAKAKFSDRVAEMTEEKTSSDIESAGIAVDKETKSAYPIKLSERTWSQSDYVTAKDDVARELAEAIGVPVEKAVAYINDVNSIAAMIAGDRTRLDYTDTGLSVFIGNVEYGGSIDMSTLCPKRRLLTGTFTAIQQALPNTALSAEDILTIRRMMDEKGLEVSCGKCYVEGSRAQMGKFAKEFINLYKKYYPNSWIPNMAQVNTPDGIEQIRIEHPEVYEQYEYFWNHYGTLRPGDPNLFASQQKPKLYQMHTAYKGEILKSFQKETDVQSKNDNGGIRFQSFSDFEIVHMIDAMQAIMDMSRVGLAGQAYTKVPAFVLAFGDTGLKINLSIDAWSIDENGKLVFNNKEGMNSETAFELRKRFSKNVGTICCVYDDAQLLAALADERIDFIIPFHRSQWKKSQYAAIGLPATTKDYTYQQNEKWIDPQAHYHDYNGRKVLTKCTNYMPNTYWDYTLSGKENAQIYLDMCARDGKRPKFYKFLDNNGDGSYSLKADGSTDGYWKLLIDFKMYDNDGNGSPQLPVQPNFNMSEKDGCLKLLEEYKGGQNSFPVAQGIVDEFVNEYKKAHPGIKYSDRNPNETVAEIEARYEKRIAAMTEQQAVEHQREQLRKIVKKLAKKFYQPTKEKNIKLGVQPVASEALKIIESLQYVDARARDIVPILTDEYISREYPTQSGKMRSARKALEKYNKLQAQIKELNDKLKGDLTDEERKQTTADVEKLMNTADGMLSTGRPLRQAIEAYREDISRASVSNALNELRTEYDKLQVNNDSGDGIWDERVSQAIATAINDGEFSGKRLSKLDSSELKSLVNLYRGVYHTMTNADKLFGAEIKRSAREMGKSAMESIIGSRGKRSFGSLRRHARKFRYDITKAIQFFDEMGSPELTQLYKDFLPAEKNVREKYVEITEWMRKAADDNDIDLKTLNEVKTVKLANGKEIEMTVGQLMKLYALSQREQAMKHIKKGGVKVKLIPSQSFFGKLTNSTKTTANAESVNMTDLDIIEAVKSLSEDDAERKRMQKFVDDVQAHQETLSAWGNVVSRALYGIDIFVEKNYTGIKSDANGLKNEGADDLNKGAMKALENAGWTKQTVPNARNPIEITDFAEDFISHAVQMANYSEFVLPLKNFRRVMNYQETVNPTTDNNDGTGQTGLRDQIDARFGSEANAYINQLLADINGTAGSNKVLQIANALVSKMKKTAVAASLSTVVQQPTAIIRAMSMISPTYFTRQKFDHRETWQNILKYTNTGIVKDQGGYDVGTAGATNADIYGDTIGRSEIGEASKRIDDISMWGAEFADQVGWNMIWRAAYAEQVSKAKRANEKIDFNSDEFLRRVGERFDDVIIHTQVYDSVLSKAPAMRSKDGWAKMATAFMAEPLTSVNMVVNAAILGARGTMSKSRVAGTVTSVIFSSVAASFFAALVYAMRDDDEDETYGEKLSNAFAEKMFSELNPANQLPLFRDVMSIIQGYDVERTDMSLVSDLVKGAKSLVKAFEGGNAKDIGGKSIAFIGSVCNVFGLPVRNVLRDVKAIAHTVVRSTYGYKTTARNVGQQWMSGMLSAFGLNYEMDSKTDKLYYSFISGDTKRHEYYKKAYKSEQDYHAALRTGLAENDVRIALAAKALNAGQMDEYEAILDEIGAEGFEQEDVRRAIRGITSNARKYIAKLGMSADDFDLVLDNYEEYKKKADSVESDDTGEYEPSVYYKYNPSDVAALLVGGNYDGAKDTIDRIIAERTAGMSDKKQIAETEKKARASIKSAITEKFKDAVIEAYANGDRDEINRIGEILLNTGLYGKKADVKATMKGWTQ